MDINTIFYFAGSQEEYNNNKLLINSRTISFVPNNDGKTGSIYKAGVKYGGDTADVINTLVSWDGKYHTGTNIGDLIVNGERTSVWVPTSSGDGSGGGIDGDQQEAINRLNDTIQRLRDSLEEIKNTADSESERLDNLYINIENSIRNKFGDMLNDANFLESLGDGWYSNFGKDLTDSEIEYYLQMIGAIEEKNGEKIYTWTKIQQEIDKLTLTTNALIRNGNLDENTVEGLYAQLQLTIQDEIARQNLAVGWGQYAEDTKDVLLWMNSQLDQGASKEETWNELVSAAKNNSGEAGIADLYTRVRNLEAGLLSEAGFNAKVDNAISGIKASTTGEYTSTQIFSRIKQNEDNIAALYTKATGQQVEAGAGVDFAGWTGGFITTANAAEALAGLVSASADNAFKAGILSLVGVDENGDRYSTFQLIAENDPNAAATIVGLVNGSGSSIQIDADKINLHGDTWAQTLHVEDLIIDTIKDSDGNSVQTSYLIDKASEKTTCSIYNNITITDTATYNDLDLPRIFTSKVVNFGDPFRLSFSHNPKYCVLDSLKVTMGSEDVTNRYVRYNYGSLITGDRPSVTIDIPQVTGDVSFSFTNPQITPVFELDGPREMKVGDVYYTYNNTPLFLLCNDSGKYPSLEVVSPSNNVINLINGTFNCVYTEDLETIANPQMSTIYILYSRDSSLDTHYEFYKWAKYPYTPYSADGQSQGYWKKDLWFSSDDTIVSVSGWGNEYSSTFAAGLTPTFKANGVGTATVGFISQAEGGDAAELHTFQVTVKDNPTDYLKSFYMLCEDGEVGTTSTIGDQDIYWAKYVQSSWITTRDPQQAPSHTITYSIDNAYSQYATISGNTITRLKQGAFKVIGTLTYGGKTYTASCWSYNLPKMFSAIDTNVTYTVDIFGNSSDDNQLVYLPQIKYQEETYNQNATYIIDGTPTKNITYARNQYEKDSHMQYICCGNNSNVTASVQLGINWIENVSILQDSAHDYVYVKFKVKEYTDAINYYTAKRENITVDDQYKNIRFGKIIITGEDGSKYIITVVQSGKYGFYGQLEDKIKNVTSAYCLTPKYAWSNLNWYGDNADAFIRTNAYPDAIITPDHGCACIAESNMTGLPNAIMGTMKSTFGENPKLVIEK